MSLAWIPKGFYPGFKGFAVDSFGMDIRKENHLHG